MTRKHWAARNSYEELARFVSEDLEESDLKYHLETMKKNATNLPVATFDELQLTINKNIETGTAIELPLVNNFSLRADKSTSMSDTSQLIIFIKVYQSHNKHSLREILESCSTRTLKGCQCSTRSNR